MCHESTSVALPKTIGVGIGTVELADFEQTDCLFFFGQNVGTNSPRMLHLLQDARKRDVPIVTFNPLRERGLVAFTNPLSVAQMATGGETLISTQYHQVKVGGDIAAITGICKALLVADDATRVAGNVRIVDADFIATHTQGWDEFRAYVQAQSWEAIEHQAQSELPLSKVYADWTVSQDPAVHTEAIARLFDSGVSIVNVHSGQPDQQKVLDFYGKEVLPRLKGNGGASPGGAL